MIAISNGPLSRDDREKLIARLDELRAIDRIIRQPAENRPPDPPPPTEGGHHNAGGAVMKLWISSAMTPHGNPYGLIAAIAETREEAIARARQALEAESHSYAPARQYAENLLTNLGAQMREVPSGVVVDWDAAQKRR